jgi:hypothetical protein
MDKTLATRCFDENFRRFGQSDEKGNLYNGLAKMATMVAALLSKVENLEQEIEALRRAPR